MFQPTPPAAKREPFVTVCHCCGQPLDMKWFDPQHPKITAKWQIECKTPGCKLEGVTTTDTSYAETIKQWLE